MMSTAQGIGILGVGLIFGYGLSIWVKQHEEPTVARVASPAVVRR